MTPTDAILTVSLVPLIAASGFFSGSETALFGLSEAERAQMRRAPTRAARAVEALQVDRRMLLITILLGNMTVNVLYFVISSVLMMRVDGGWAAAIGLGTLLGIILFGEVLPKMVASTRRITIASLAAPPLLVVHRTLGPLRVILNRLVVEPLSRLTAPTERPPELSADELAALLDLSGGQGVIDADEQTQIRNVIDLRGRTVRDVMTPRVRIHAVAEEAGRDEVLATARRARVSKLPIYRGDIDHVVGVLHVKRYLMDPADDPAILGPHSSPASFVPEVAQLEHLLDHFRKTSTQSAIVVDEYGGTAGLVALEDVVEELVGDIVGADEPDVPPVRPVDEGTWRVSGDMSVREWAEAFGQPLAPRRVATIGGLILDRLGRAPRAADVVDVGNLILTVEVVDQTRVVSVLLRLVADAEGAS